MHKNNVSHFPLHKFNTTTPMLGSVNLEEEGRKGKLFTSNKYSPIFWYLSFTRSHPIQPGQNLTKII